MPGRGGVAARNSGHPPPNALRLFATLGIGLLGGTALRRHHRTEGRHALGAGPVRHGVGLRPRTGTLTVDRPRCALVRATSATGGSTLISGCGPASTPSVGGTTGPGSPAPDL